MKLEFAAAYIGAVTNLMLKHGSGDNAQLVPATAVKIESEILPVQLEELRAGLRDKFFEPGSEPGIPSLPELGALIWKTEYAGGTIAFGLDELKDLDFEVKDGALLFHGANLKDIEFEPLAKGTAAFNANVIIKTDGVGRGQLAALLKHKVKATFTLASQQPLDAPVQENTAQGTLEIAP